MLFSPARVIFVYNKYEVSGTYLRFVILNLMKAIIVIGWIAIAGGENVRLSLKVWTPQGRGLHLRTPALLSKSVVLRGTRISDAPTYRDGRQAYKA